MNYRISLHPYLAAVLESAVGLVLLWWLWGVQGALSIEWWLAARVAATTILVSLVYCPPPLKRLSLWGSLILPQICFAFLVTIIDARGLAELAGLGVVALSALTYVFLPATAPDLSFAFKPARRARLMLGVIAVFSAAAGWFSLSALQLADTLWYAAAGLALITLGVGMAVWWWREYGIDWSVKMIWAGGILFLLLLESAWFIWWWPIGYLALGFIWVWWWYFWWLILRFQLTTEGIIWRKQIPFLVFNGLAMAVYLLFIVRWK